MSFRDHFRAGRPNAEADDRQVENASAPGAQAVATSREPADERYRVISIGAVRAPEGCAGADWLSYRITQGSNEITGYRRGTLESVRAVVDTIVAALNSRRDWGKSEPKSHRRVATRARREDVE